MFEGLKKKFSSFIDSLSKKEEEKAPEPEQKQQEAGIEAPQDNAASAYREPAPKEIVQEKPEPKPPQPAHEIPKEKPREEVAVKVQEPAKVHAEKIETRANAHHNEDAKPEHHIEKQITEERKAKPIVHEQPAVQPIHNVKAEKAESAAKAPAPKPHVHETPQVAPQYKEQHQGAKIEVTHERKEKEPQVSTFTKIKGMFLGHVKISEKDADPFIEGLKMGLLQSDVNYDVTERITDNIRRNLVGREVSSRNIAGDIRQGIRESILGVLSSRSEVQIISKVREKAAAGQLPYKILFVGPNGAGKTTTMAKVASMLLSNGISCVLSASDTFRAAAIEQTVYHAGKLGINVIKGTYGADPASVAFDAIAHAKAHNIMVVLIDSAGRQETNKSLIEELKKMARVTAPDMKIFIGESISGNALLDQVKAINEAVSLDGIILTKLDVDAKGGNTLSILSDTTIPILYFGTGEKYTDIMPYDPQFIVDNILPNN